MDMKLDERLQARNLYFQTNLTQQEIADRVGVNRKTLYGWINEGDWRHAKYTAAHAPSLLTDQYYEQLGMLNKAIAARENPWPTVEESRVIGRLASVIKQFKFSTTNLSDAIDVFQTFITYLQREEGQYELAKEFIKPMDRYVKKMVDQSSSIKYNKVAQEENNFQRELAELHASSNENNISVIARNEANSSNTNNNSVIPNQSAEGPQNTNNNSVIPNQSVEGQQNTNNNSVIPSHEPALRNRSAEGPHNTDQNNTDKTAPAKKAVIARNEATSSNTNNSSVITSPEPVRHGGRNRSAEGPQSTDQNNIDIIAKNERPLDKPNYPTPPPDPPIYPSAISALRLGTKPGTIIVEGQEIPEFPGWRMDPYDYQQKYGVSKRRTICDLLNAKYLGSVQKSSQNFHRGA